MTAVCAIPLSDENGAPLFDADGNRLQCGKPVLASRLPSLIPKGGMSHAEQDLD